jgi:hypothetical protein
LTISDKICISYISGEFDDDELFNSITNCNFLQLGICASINAWLNIVSLQYSGQSDSIVFSRTILLNEENHVIEASHVQETFTSPHGMVLLKRLAVSVLNVIVPACQVRSVDITSICVIILLESLYISHTIGSVVNHVTLNVKNLKSSTIAYIFMFPYVDLMFLYHIFSFVKNFSVDRLSRSIGFVTKYHVVVVLYLLTLHKTLYEFGILYEKLKHE